ncbi:flagellar basal-body rod protein FlgC [Thermacetogenium phaeum DSM 12270]|uniref:Flagellar basal-body rod protein FlgC n=3 Tax=Thermacetogenium phaeum TaxID=85874 RepID=K4LGY6_THEPS|nr:flagellar basal-body rod protein FlgC [Thermacetogenium phaeum DSM 12270]KUK36200.1 MAG: Flagellar basal-body rod protein FlgC [Thermacetogenium phaeum]MDN5375163.1 flagellar basal-body rod protein FlgC [Thermacetogenium sp.]
MAMGLFTGFQISGSGLTAQRLRLDVIAGNIANAETTRSGEVDADGRPLPYRRKMVVLEAGRPFDYYLGKKDPCGVRVRGIVEDAAPPRLVYNPDHPDADPQGYVRMPNVNVLEEMVDLIDATRAYEANVAALNATKEMCLRALDIGRR